MHVDPQLVAPLLTQVASSDPTPSTSTDNMENPDYYSDRKFCSTCNDYVPYLMSLEHSYCASCGQEVRLFSKEDWGNFNRTMEERRPKGGRPRKQQSRDKESA
jgi:hypothetical protein